MLMMVIGIEVTLRSSVRYEAHTETAIPDWLFEISRAGNQYVLKLVTKRLATISSSVTMAKDF